MGDAYGTAAAWVNISVTFLEATLYLDARVCYQRADEMAAFVQDESQRSSVQSRALHGAALCGLYLHEFLQGVESCDEALRLLSDPRDREQEQIRALVEATYAQILLALNRVDEAAQHATSARRWPFGRAQRERRFPLPLLAGLLRFTRAT